MAQDSAYKLPSATKAARVTITPALMRAIQKIESGGDPNARTGSYKGLYQLSDSEFKRLGGLGDIFNPKENTRIAMLKLQQEADQVAAKLGRPLTPGEIYLVHQQGVGGAYEHITQPNRPAWQSMSATGEGRAKGEGWSRLAIWGNVPDQTKAQYGTVDNLTSGEFTKMWSDRIAREGGGDSDTAAPVTGPDPTPNVGSGEADYRMPEVADPTPNVGSGEGDYPPAQGALADAVAPPSQKTNYGDAAAEALKGLGSIYGAGAARNAGGSGPAAVPTATALPPQGPFPMVDPKVAEAQRQQLAVALQRLNSGKLV